MKKNKLYQHRPQIAKTNFCVILSTTSTPPKLVVTPPHHSTLQRHPAMAPRPLLQSWSSPSKHTAMAPCNGTTSTPSKLVVTLPPNHTMAPCNGTTSTPPMAPRPLPQSGRRPPPPTLRWHPAMAPSNGTTSTQPKHYNGTLRRHPAMAPRPLNQSTTMAPYEGIQQWHHVHSTLQGHPAMAPRPLNHSTPQRHPALAPRPLHPAMAFWCHVQCAKVVRRPPPLLEVRTPIAIAIWGTKEQSEIKEPENNSRLDRVLHHKSPKILKIPSRSIYSCGSAVCKIYKFKNYPWSTPGR